MIRTIQLISAVLFVLFLGIISSCEKKPEQKELSQREADSIITALNAIEDSLEVAWDRMIEDDDQKIADAKRLLEEISYTNFYDPVQYDSLQQNLKTLAATRYNINSMANSVLIDDYDSSSNKVMNEIITMASSHPEFQRYPLMKELIADIQQANSRVLRHRVNYDYAAKQYNQFIEEHKEELEEIDSLKEIQKKPLFELAS